LGASVWSIMVKMSSEFVKWVIISAVIAFPSAYLILQSVLSFYANKTPLSAWIFVAAGVCALAVSLLTVSYQLFKTATQSPANVLKYE